MRKSILSICFFPAFNPPASGGELRLLNLYRALSETFSVTLLTSTDFGARQEEFFHTQNFREIRFPKDKLWRNAYALLEKSGIHGDLSGLAFALAVNDPTCALRQTARSLAPGADHIIHEFPFSEPIFSDGLHASKEIYNSHNFEASLLSAIVHGSGFETAFLKLTRLEGGLVARARRVFATAQADADKFRLFYGVPSQKLGLCPNGFDDAELVPVASRREHRVLAKGERPRLLYFGSAHHPNVEAANALIAMAPVLADYDIVIAGGVSQAIASPSLPPNVLVHGPFDEATKLSLLVGADIFLNPVVLGSGTSLKALEALGAGIPLLSTPGGVRGLELESGYHAVIVERKMFPMAVKAMLEDPERATEMGRTGQVFATERYTWRSIAARMAEEIHVATVDAPQDERPIVLAFNDYSVLDASWGGKARIRSLLVNIHADVVLMSFGDRCDIVLLGQNLLHVVVPKGKEHISFEEASNQGQSLSVNDCVAALFVASSRIMGDIAASVARRARAVVFEHCYMAPILDVIDPVRPGIPVVYSAHNVEAEHRVTMLAAHTAGRSFGAFVERLETELTQRAALVVCCTEADARHFAERGAQTVVVANGCRVPLAEDLDRARLEDDGPDLRVGFMGSSHGPNVDAASFIVTQLAPAFPQVAFELLGGVGESLRDTIPDNVLLRGIVDDETKTEILAGWSIALNPVASGGGSSLKLPDFMAHGLATISTPSGARGFDIEHHGAGIVAERGDFAAALRQLLSDPGVRSSQQANAHRYAAERLSWNVVVEPYAARLSGMMEASPLPAPAVRRSLLVVTYRYTEPALGGAEEYLIEVLKRLRPRFERIDLAAVDVGQLTNEHHFGCRIADANAGASSRIGELFDKAHFFTPDVLPDTEVIERCRRLQRAWSVGEFDLYLPFAKFLAEPDRLRLFSGFYWPENHGEGVRRWTSANFSLLLPRNASALRLVGFGDRPKKLAMTLIRLTSDLVPEIVAEFEQQLSTWFTVNIALPRVIGGDALIIHCDVDEHHAEGDHRPFGVLLEAASVLIDRRGEVEDEGVMAELSESRADLGEDKDQILRTQFFDEWVSALNNLGRRNSAAIEADFAAVRGPHSAAMQGWIASHREDYDMILVQGIPFDVVPRTIETLRHFPDRPRVVALPHFHGDDRFYHWRRYMEAFEAADSCLLFSRSIADRLGLSGRIDIVPGGGVRSTEQGDVAAVNRFRDIHSSTTPFFLILGRKTASKGYERVIAAQAALRTRGHTVDVVMIGPEEDGRGIQQDGVVYLGRQPREVVRGALSECRGLVSMSNSESFGIVLCEAWLFGKPVIANRACHSFRELVDEERTGLLAGSDAELAAAMEVLLGREDMAQTMGRNGRKSVLKNYTWQQVANQIFDVLVESV